MRVAVDGAFLGAARGGDETFLRGLLEGLACCHRPGDVFPLVLADAPVPPVLRGDPAFPVLRVPRRPGPWHFAVTLPDAVRRAVSPDLVVAVTHLPLRTGDRGVLVLGDLSFLHRPGDYPTAVATRLRALVPRQARAARAVLVPSEYTRADVVATLGLDPTRVHVVPNRVVLPEPGHAAAGAVTTAMRARGVVGRYLLYLGNLHPRKNVARLVRAFRAARGADPALADCRLVVAGGRWFGGHDEQDAAASDPAVVFLGRVTDDERSALLAGASALAYVSLFEGFGLPPLEAMAHGVPVLASATTSLPEVCGEAALLVDPADTDAVTAGVVRILTDVALRSRLRVQGPARAAGFDTARVGAATLRAFDAALAATTFVPSPRHITRRPPWAPGARTDATSPRTSPRPSR